MESVSSPVNMYMGKIKQWRTGDGTSPLTTLELEAQEIQYFQYFDIWERLFRQVTAF